MDKAKMKPIIFNSEMVRVLLVAHGGGRNDTIVTVEIKR